MNDEQPPREWELKLKWVVLTGLLLWLFGAIALVIYLADSRGAP